jgi:hypothetical protein
MVLGEKLYSCMMAEHNLLLKRQIILVVMKLEYQFFCCFVLQLHVEKI